jgi:hypothetical protein
MRRSDARRLYQRQTRPMLLSFDSRSTRIGGPSSLPLCCRPHRLWFKSASNSKQTKRSWTATATCLRVAVSASFCGSRPTPFANARRCLANEKRLRPTACRPLFDGRRYKWSYQGFRTTRGRARAHAETSESCICTVQESALACRVPRQAGNDTASDTNSSGSKYAAGSHRLIPRDRRSGRIRTQSGTPHPGSRRQSSST